MLIQISHLFWTHSVHALGIALDELENMGKTGETPELPPPSKDTQLTSGQEAQTEVHSGLEPAGLEQALPSPSPPEPSQPPDTSADILPFSTRLRQPVSTLFSTTNPQQQETNRPLPHPPPRPLDQRIPRQRHRPSSRNRSQSRSPLRQIHTIVTQRSESQ